MTKELSSDMKWWLIERTNEVLYKKMNHNPSNTEEFGYYDSEGDYINHLEIIDFCDNLDNISEKDFKWLDELRAYILRLPRNHRLFYWWRKYLDYHMERNPESYAAVDGQNQSWKMILNHALRRHDDYKKVINKHIKYLQKTVNKNRK